jgi:hypothetical protein
MATAASSLPPTAFATGSAVVNMLRQVGLAIGVAVLIAVLGTPHTPADTVVAYQRASWVTAAIALFGGAVGLALLAARRRPAPTAAPDGAPIGPAIGAAGEGLRTGAAS